MSLSDPIADMLTRVRNAHMAELDVVDVPHSRIKAEIARVLKKEGFVKDYVIEGGIKKILRIFLRYTESREPVIHGVERSSKPGRRVYVAVDEVPRILGGMGVAILSTSAGIMTDRDARKQNVGGEVLCSVW